MEITFEFPHVGNLDFLLLLELVRTRVYGAYNERQRRQTSNSELGKQNSWQETRRELRRLTT